MVDQLSGSNEQLEIARRISAATGNETTIAVIVAPGEQSIGDAFFSLAGLRNSLASLGDDVSVRSVDTARDQLFLYGLDEKDPLPELLRVLRETPQSAAIISRLSHRFLVVINAPEALAPQALGLVQAHPWKDAFVESAILASAHLERDVADGLARDLRILLPAIVAATLVALFVAFAYWRALLLPLSITGRP